MENPSLFTIYGDSIYLDRIIAESPEQALALFHQDGTPEGYVTFTAIPM